MKLLKSLSVAALAFTAVGCQTYVVNVPPPRPVYTSPAPKKASASVTPTVNQTPDVIRAWDQ